MIIWDIEVRPWVFLLSSEAYLLKILPSSHSSVTWYIVVNVSVYLIFSIKSGVLDIVVSRAYGAYCAYSDWSKCV